MPETNAMTAIRRILLAVTLIAAAGVKAEAQNAVFGAAGEVYTARVDACEKLFDRKSCAEPGHPVLAIEVARPGGAQPERWLVPETEGGEVERVATLLFEDSSRTLFIAWESWDKFPVLKLAGFDGKSWDKPVSIIGNPWAEKSSPQLAVTHDTYRLSDEDEARDQTTLHLVWGEQTAPNTFETFYSPVFFENGAFSGDQPPVFRLDELDESLQGEIAATLVPPELLPILRIVPGKHSQALIIVFVSARTNRLMSLEVEMLPAQLGRLADEARMHIIDLGAKHSYPAGYKKVADYARMHIIDLGARGFQPEVAQAMAQQVNDLILQDGGTSKLSVIADHARMHIIDLGAKLTNRGLRPNTSMSQTSIREISGQEIPGEEVPSVPHILSFRVAASWQVPQLGAGSIRYYPAKSGNDLLVAWVDGNFVKYRETQGDEWSPTREIALSGALDLDRAYQMLDEKMSRR